jgi:hypothetical protein
MKSAPEGTLKLGADRPTTITPTGPPASEDLQRAPRRSPHRIATGDPHRKRKEMVHMLRRFIALIAPLAVVIASFAGGRTYGP